MISSNAGQGLHNEVGRALLEALVPWALLVAANWSYHWAIAPRNGHFLPPVRWGVVALVLAAFLVYGVNFKRTPARPVFAFVRTLSHLLFGIGTPPAIFLGFGFMAPHGMSGFSIFWPWFGGALACAAAGYVLMRWIVAQQDEPQGA